LLFLREWVRKNREAFESLADLIEQGALRFSSGSTAEFVRRGPDGQILRWPIVELSVTPTPAEWRLPKVRRI
jgi:hypothetical protein